MYPYPSYGAAGPVSGGLEGRQESVQNPCPLEGDTGRKGVKSNSGNRNRSTCCDCHYLSGISASYAGQAVDVLQPSCAPSLLRDMEHMMFDVVERAGDDEDDAGRDAEK